jgi:hypothetical protein
MNKWQVLRIAGVALMAITPCVSAEQFELKDAAKGEVSFGEQTVISKIGFDFAATETTTSTTNTNQLLAAAPERTFTVPGKDGSVTVTYGRTQENLPWVREVAARGNRVEISSAVYVTPQLRREDYEYARLKIYLPMALLQNARHERTFGRNITTTDIRSGPLADAVNDTAFINGARQVQFKGGALDFMIDLGPTGPWGMYGDDPASTYKGHLQREGDEYVFVIPAFGARWGTKLIHKFVLYADTHDLAQFHPVRAVHYTWRMPATHRVQFTDGQPVQGFAIPNADGYPEFMPWSNETYDEQKGLGWKTIPAGKLIAPSQNAQTGPLFSGGWAGTGAGIFQMKSPNGFYLANIMLSGMQGGGGVEVRANEGAWQKVKVSANSRRTMTISLEVKDEIVQLEVRGSQWVLSGLTTQPMFFEHEDFLFSRSWWAGGQEPWKHTVFVDKAAWSAWPEGGFGPKKLLKPVVVSP